MDELVTIMDLHFSGTAHNYTEVIKMSVGVVFVLTLGFILWRIMSGFSGGRKRPASSKFFGNPYADQWHKKIK